MEKKATLNCHILVGLPGSGKTTWAYKQRELMTKDGSYPTFGLVNKSYNGGIIDIDYLILSGKNHWRWLDNIDPETEELDMGRVIRNNTCIDTSVDGVIYIDGLFLTNDDVIDMIKKLAVVGKTWNVKINIIIDQWEEDREKCKINDKMRLHENLRNEDSIHTIVHAPYEQIYIEDIEAMILDGTLEINDISLERHVIEIPEDWQMFLEIKGTPEEASVISGESWCTGGTWASYNGDGYLTAETPKENEKLIEILTKIAPDIKYLEYLKIEKGCSKIVETTEYDYYGGCGHYSHWEIDSKKLYEMLKEMGYTKNA